MTAHDDVSRMASDPATDWATLHWIAENHPELRPDVAANPNTYPELLEALADLDDPAINAVLMRRFWPQDQLPISEPEPEPESEPEPEPEPVGVLLPGDDMPDHEPSAAEPGQASAAAAAGEATASGAGAGAPAGGAVGGGTPGGSRRRRRAGLVVLAVVLPLIALGAIVALGFTLLGERSTPAAEQSPPPEPEPTAAEPEESPEPPAEEPDEPEDEGPTPEEVRAALQDLPDDSSCEAPGDDAELFDLLVDTVNEQESWGQADADLAQDTVEDLRSECGDPHAARVFQLLSGEEAEHEELVSAVGGMGTEWFNYAFPATGAQELARFSSPDGNVICEIGESLRCRVLEHSFEAPEDCEDGATYRISVDEGPLPDCENPVSDEDDAPVLQYGQTAGNGFFACTSFQSQMSCWNQLTGEGINLSATRNSIY
ncbi:variant leucine-rich repeat-containing protein [Nesterenkonia suensis]